MLSLFERNKQILADYLGRFPRKDKAAIMTFIGSLKPCECTTRYVRKDVETCLCELGPPPVEKGLGVALLNISCQGALITTELELDIGAQLTLDFKFMQGAEFKIKGRVVNKRGQPPQFYYGIKFLPENSELCHFLSVTRQQALQSD